MTLQKLAWSYGVIFSKDEMINRNKILTIPLQKYLQEETSFQKGGVISLTLWKE
jgi:hypothetical protein